MDRTFNNISNNYLWWHHFLFKTFEVKNLYNVFLILNNIISE